MLMEATPPQVALVTDCDVERRPTWYWLPPGEQRSEENPGLTETEF